MTTTFIPTLDLARKLIAAQFPEYSNLPITDVEKQGHDNRTYRLGDHVSLYDKGAREQIAELAEIIDAGRALVLWDKACGTKWNNPPIWIHGDFAIGNMLVSNRHHERSDVIQENDDNWIASPSARNDGGGMYGTVNKII
jgi:aminoglycoside phosphotransferase (APT) family kinase protein